MTKLNSKLKLTCGATLANRIAKAAMTEGLADAYGRPTEELNRLYGLWSDSGASMLISGNIQIDADHLERPGNVVIDQEPDADMLARLKAWTEAATRGGNHFWAQISHAGRQTQKVVNKHPKAPSAATLGLPGGQFGKPVEMTVDEIKDLTTRFAMAAKVCKQSEFTGVQIHAAHGYLLSSFLNPRANQREDEYGGSLENRARFLMDVVAATRKAVGKKFPISVKLNSADFQKNGFAFEDSLKVAKMLEKAGIDLLEISGGNYENPKMVGAEGIDEQAPDVAPSTLAREAYFIDFATIMQKEISIPLMVTGGFRSRAVMEEALTSGAADLLGLGRPMCTTLDAPRQILDGLDKLATPENDLRLIPNALGFLRRIQLLKAVDSFAVQFWFYGQFYAIGRTGKPDHKLKPLSALIEVERMNRSLMKQRRK
jgi:2,4-dienoyl-CoA reductase-like NADH-dependent reductase (Old Yellow Enzyme family)